MHVALGNGMYGANRAGLMEDVAEQLVDTTIGTVALQQQSENEAVQRAGGDRQRKQHALVGRLVQSKGIVEGVLALGGLLVDGLGADLDIGRVRSEAVSLGDGRQGGLLQVG